MQLQDLLQPQVPAASPGSGCLAAGSAALSVSPTLSSAAESREPATFHTCDFDNDRRDFIRQPAALLRREPTYHIISIRVLRGISGPLPGTKPALGKTKRQIRLQGSSSRHLKKGLGKIPAFVERRQTEGRFCSETMLEFTLRSSIEKRATHGCWGSDSRRWPPHYRPQETKNREMPLWSEVRSCGRRADRRSPSTGGDPRLEWR